MESANSVQTFWHNLLFPFQGSRIPRRKSLFLDLLQRRYGITSLRYVKSQKSAGLARSHRSRSLQSRTVTVSTECAYLLYAIFSFLSFTSEIPLLHPFLKHSKSTVRLSFTAIKNIIQNNTIVL